MIRLLTMLSLTLLLSTGLARAQSDEPPASRAALERLFTASALQADWFTPAVLAQWPPALLQQLFIEHYKALLGAYQQVEEADGDYTVVFQNGTLHALIRLDTDDRIATIVFLGSRFNPEAQGPRGALPEPRTVLERLFTADRFASEWFSPGFAFQIPPDLLQRRYIAPYQALLGGYQRIEGADGRYSVLFQNGSLDAVLDLDADGRISTLVFTAVHPTAAAGQP
jgi:hypothetical protein